MSKTKKNSIILSILIAFFVFIISFIILSMIGLVPRSINYFDTKPVIKNYDQVISINENNYIRPDRITIDKVGIDSIIEQPNTVDIPTLDQALNKGAVHYPGSGSVTSGNMFIFGHSSNWAVVQNQAYKTFNGLERLKNNDEIKVMADGREFIYKVTSVNLVDEDDALVEFNNSDRTLTISTCNTFGEKQERWVVEAEFFKEA
jgi:LPXTG-site transpeptidase (sortase) family protein